MTEKMSSSLWINMLIGTARVFGRVWRAANVFEENHLRYYPVSFNTDFTLKFEVNSFRRFLGAELHYCLSLTNFTVFWATEIWIKTFRKSTSNYCSILGVHWTKYIWYPVGMSRQANLTDALIHPYLEILIWNKTKVSFIEQFFWCILGVCAAWAAVTPGPRSTSSRASSHPRSLNCNQDRGPGCYGWSRNL